MNRYTNIRYHIYKELSKYRKIQERRRSERIRELAIPIITGIIVVLITNRLIIQFRDLNNWCYIVFIFFTVLGYYAILLLIETISFFIENKFIPDWRTIIKIRPTDIKYKSVQEEDAAKFNYEVTYLVESAYCQVNGIDTKNNLMFRISLLNTLFSIKNALRKMHESLLGCSGKIHNELVSYSMIEVVLEMVSATLSTIKTYDESQNGDYSDEIDFVIGFYDDTKKQIEEIYQI